MPPIYRTLGPCRHRHPRPLRPQDGPPGVTIAERVDLGLATVMARKGQAAALRDAVQARLWARPPRLVAASSPGRRPGSSAPGRDSGWRCRSSCRTATSPPTLSAKLQGLASISDQSDGRAVVRISGPRARDVLAKGLPIDLDPSVFAPGSAATSVISLMGVTLWQVDDAPTYDIAVFRSLAGSFWKWLTDSAAEYGYTVEARLGLRQRDSAQRSANASLRAERDKRRRRRCGASTVSTRGREMTWSRTAAANRP